MKIKWLVILSLVCVGLILISFLFSRGNYEVNENKTANPEANATNRENITGLPAEINLQEAKPKLDLKPGITIVGKAEKNQEDKIPTETITNQNVTNPSDFQNAPKKNPGVEKEGKYPTEKEIKELNSAGIVMY